MRHAWILVALAACKQGTGDDYPINPGGDDIGDFHPPVDGPASDQSLGDGGAMINGRVCLLADLRAPTMCANTGAANITVQLGTATTLTADDGMFSLVSPGGTNLAWRVSAADLATSIVPVSTSTILPIIAADDYADMQLTSGVIINSGQGSIVLFVRDALGPLAGAAVTVTPTQAFAPKRDMTRLLWVDGDTGASGASWTAGLTAGSVSVKVTPPTGTPQVFALPVADGAITYTTVAF